ncbi:NAD-dependent malic enzyme [SAR202 cluster bacterium AD-493-K16_JPT_193m]|nr:NAD-dependent malic enzyme [SAR202 cluster bacterium AD-493-K16_JPT_193m]
MSNRYPAVAYSVTLRVAYKNIPGHLGVITTEIGKVGGDIGAIDIVSTSSGTMIRDITVNARDIDHGAEIVSTIDVIDGVSVRSVSDPTFLLHLGGKITMASKIPVKTRNDLSLAYTPGVARVSMAINSDPSAVWSLTSKSNTVAVVTDGTAVLGLGNIGPAAAMPVMEGKAMLFKELAGVNSWPICLNTSDPEKIIQIVKHISPGFGGINLEDIAAPNCFYVEERLREELDIPVFHDDQHGTAIVVLAALYNALEVVGKKIDQIKIVMSGAGAAGLATAKLMNQAGVSNIVGYDREGILHSGIEFDGHPGKLWFAEKGNIHDFRGDLKGAMRDADVFIGLSGPNVLNVDHLKVMAKDSIVFAMANPDPEIEPESAVPYVRVIATGRSDYANQINNVLAFPGVFRGILDSRSKGVNDEMKIAAAWAIASAIPRRHLNEEYIIPSVFDKSVVRRVATAVAKAARATGMAPAKRSKTTEIAEFTA